MAEVYYVIRRLSPKEKGLALIVHAFSSTAEITLTECQQRWPTVFERPGFYSLMRSTAQTLNVEPPK